MNFTPRPAQARILAYTGGKLGISAVPGSGKTHTLSALAAQLIRSGKIGDEQEVLIVTLVNSAVDNFSNRIKDFLGLPMPFGYRVRTLHGLAHDLVREKPSAVGLEERFTILDERDASIILRDAAGYWLATNSTVLDAYLDADLDESKHRWVQRDQLPDIVTGIALAFIRSAKDARLTPARVRSLLENAASPLPLAEMGCYIYEEYQKALNYRGAVDFDDLIRLAIDLLENEPEFLERLRRRWPYILEDEAQDSSLLQEQILRLLAGPQGNWVRVGDPNQAIFETFTTASPQHLINFIHEEADQYNELPNSGRCQGGIIRLANQLIHWVNNAHQQAEVRNALTVPLIEPTSPDDPQPNPPDDPGGIHLVHKAYSASEEIEAIVRSLTRWLPEHPDSTVAVLVPRNARGAEVINALKLQGLDFVELLGSTFSTRVAASRMGDVVGALCDPGSASKLSKAYLAWRRTELEIDEKFQQEVASLIHECEQVETYLSPRTDRDWLKEMEKVISPEVHEELKKFQGLVNRWQGTILLPVDQMILSISQDLYTIPADLALAHKLAMLLQQLGESNAGWRLPELADELNHIARNERRFIGFSEDDSGFDPSHYPGKVVVTTMHKAKGLEWDRVYLTSANNYDFPSNPTADSYITERKYIRAGLDLQAETLAQLRAICSRDEYQWYEEGKATRQARLDYIRERLRLFYVGITRAKRELVITWNTGRFHNQNQAAPFKALQDWWDDLEEAS